MVPGTNLLLRAGIEVQPHLRRHARREQTVFEVLVLVNLRYRESESTLFLCEGDAEACQRAVQKTMRLLRATAQHLQRFLPLGNHGFRFECSLSEDGLRLLFSLTRVD